MNHFSTLLCPNCHTQTKTWGHRSQKEKNNKEKKVTIISFKNQERLKELLVSNIDFSKYGWVSQAAEIMGLPPQKVNKWMKRNAKEFYEQKCFKRK